MNILHVIPAFYPAVNWGGSILSTLCLCNCLHKIENVRVKVLTTDAAGPVIGNNIAPAEILHTKIPYDIRYCHRIAGNSLSLELLHYLGDKIKWADLVHLTAVYSFPTIPTLFLARCHNKPIVWSPHGSLQRWPGTTKPHLKLIWEYICKSIADHMTCCIHVTSPMEEAASKKILPNFTYKVIANGVDIPKFKVAPPPFQSGLLRIVFIGRIHPIKGIENLIIGLSKLDNINYKLTICGSGEPKFTNRIKALCKNLGIMGRMDFVGHLKESERDRLLFNSDICVVPSHTENFGMVVAEALACGVPVICSKGAPWPDLHKHECGIWTDNTPRSIANAVRKIMTMDLSMMGKRGRQWMEREFNWRGKANSMLDLYREMIAKQET